MVGDDQKPHVITHVLHKITHDFLVNALYGLGTSREDFPRGMLRPAPRHGRKRYRVESAASRAHLAFAP